MNVLFNRVISLIFFSIFIGSFVFAQNSDNQFGIIPVPVSLKTNEGQFLLSNKTIIRTDSVKNKSVRFLLNYLSQSYHLQNKPISIHENGNTLDSTVDIICNGNENLPEEGYQLQINPKKITLTGKGAGLFYGIQTLIQLIAEAPNNRYALPCMEIKDYPRFKYRGLLLDVSRHFFNVSEVKQLIDLMAQYKLNTFQWHLVDNQGWRIEIKKYPKLTSVGAYDMNPVIDGNRDELDGVSTGGFYTQEQIKEIVRYADDRFITTIKGTLSILWTQILTNFKFSLKILASDSITEQNKKCNFNFRISSIIVHIKSPQKEGCSLYSSDKAHVISSL